MSPVEQATRRWLKEYVLRLGLCPFAAPVMEGEALRLVVTSGKDGAAFLRVFEEEVERLIESDPEELASTLWVLPEALPENFPAFYEWTEDLAQYLADTEPDAGLQLVAFHPLFELGNEDALPTDHFVNRSPFPIVHFLRADQVEAAGEKISVDSITQTNSKRLAEIGLQALQAQLDSYKL